MFSRFPHGSTGGALIQNNTILVSINPRILGNLVSKTEEKQYYFTRKIATLNRRNNQYRRDYIGFPVLQNFKFRFCTCVTVGVVAERFPLRDWNPLPLRRGRPVCFSWFVRGSWVVAFICSHWENSGRGGEVFLKGRGCCYTPPPPPKMCAAFFQFSELWGLCPIRRINQPEEQAGSLNPSSICTPFIGFPPDTWEGFITRTGK